MCRRGGIGVSVAHDFGVRGAPRIMTSRVQDMVTVRGVERLKDQILRRISTGRVGKRGKVLSVDIVC